MRVGNQMISIRKYWNQRVPDENGALRRALGLLLQSLEIHTAPGDDVDYTQFRSGMEGITSRFGADTPPEDLADYISREHTPERYRDMLADDRFTILIAKVAGNLAGLALLVQAPAPPEMQSPAAALELRRFYIDSAYHGRGVANLLMKEVLAVATDRGEPSLWLSAFSGNGRALSFYKRWGFRIAGTHDFIVGTDRQKDYLMLYESSSNLNDAKGDS